MAQWDHRRSFQATNGQPSMLSPVTSTLPPQQGILMLPWHSTVDPSTNDDRNDQPPSDVTDARVDLVSVLGPSPEAMHEVHTIFNEAVESSWKRRAFAADASIFPYDTTPMLISPSLLTEFEKTVELAKSRPHVAHRLITPQVSLDWRLGSTVHVCCSTCVDSSASGKACDTISVHSIIAETTRPLGDILRSLRS